MIRRVVFRSAVFRVLLLLTFGWTVGGWLPGTVCAQFETPAPVRPAMPVSPTPAEPPMARAVPFDPPVPRPANPNPAYPAPGSDAIVDPAPPPSTGSPEAGQQRRASRGKQTPVPADASAPAPAASPATDDSTDIRIAPQAAGPAVPPDVVQFNLANDLYVRKQYAQAAPEYERYLGEFAEGAQRQAALWWLGECYRILNRLPAARSTYQNLVIAFKDGEFVGPACFRLATIDFNAQDYRSALPLFERSAGLAKADDVRLSSRYFQALCLEKLDRRSETLLVYEDILNVTANNPYRDDAHLALARQALADKRPNEAFKQYEALSREATKPALQAESSLKAALLARDLDQTDTAATLLTRAITLAGASTAVRADAMVAQLHLLYDTNKYKQLLDSYPEFHAALTDALQPEAMLLAANAQRQLGQHVKAQAIYDEIIATYPNSAQAPEARYQRIISLYATNDPNFVKEADDFVGQSSDPVETAQVRLMKADTLFKQGNYLPAAYAYNILDGSTNLPDKYKAETAYRLGYCYAQAHEADKTITAFTRFLHAYPQHPFAVKAFIQRAVAFQQKKDYAAALGDFKTVIDDYPKAKEREAAWQQIALIQGQQGDDKGMTETFRTLLKEYPKTDAAGLAHFYIGRSAFAAADYPGALESFEAARKADPKEYGAKAGLLMILCEYQLKNATKLAADIASYDDARMQPPVPAEILRWLGEQEYDAKDYATAEKHLAAATSSPGNRSADTWMLLAQARLNLKKWDGVLTAIAHYLEGSGAMEPAAHAQALLVAGGAQIGLAHYEEAQKDADLVLQLQPEGTLNAKARLLAGRIASARGKDTDAAKLYMSVSVLYDDPQITPLALTLASAAFAKIGQTDEAAKAGAELKKRFPDYVAPKTD